MAIKYKVAWENDPVDIKYLEDRYYWNDFQDYETFTHWMLEHEKDGSVEEVDVLSDEEVNAIIETTKMARQLTDKLYDQLLEVDGISIRKNIKEYDTLIIIDSLYDSILKNVHKLERAW